MKIFFKINKVDVLIIGDLCKKIRYLTTNIKETCKIGTMEEKNIFTRFLLTKISS